MVLAVRQGVAAEGPDPVGITMFGAQRVHGGHAAGAVLPWACTTPPKPPHPCTCSLRDFQAGAFQLQEAGGALEAIAVRDCAKLTDTTLRTLLCLEGGTAAGVRPVLGMRLLWGKGRQCGDGPFAGMPPLLRQAPRHAVPAPQPWAPSPRSPWRGCPRCLTKRCG